MALFLSFLGLVAANLVVAVVCSFARRYTWAHWLARIATLITLLAILWIVKILVENAHLKESPAGVFATPGMLLLLELPLFIYLSLGVRSQPRRPR